MSDWKNDIMHIILPVDVVLSLIRTSNSAESRTELLRMVGSHAYKCGDGKLMSICDKMQTEYGINVFGDNSLVATSPQNSMDDILSEGESVYNVSQWDMIFHDSIDVAKVKCVLPSITSNKVLDIKRWYVIYKVLKEIDWLKDSQSTHFIAWVKDVYGWEWETKDFKRVLSGFKNTPTYKWGEDTIKDALTGIEYKVLADQVRNKFVTITNGVIKDNTYFFKKTDLYISHPKKLM
ncbi:MAG: hypothetical protein IKN15_12730 [Bacteroidaceae bacterium]|nr:hypothetical protein [Bacteroidaceae bacterium]